MFGEVAFPPDPLLDQSVFVAGPASVAESFEVAGQVVRHPLTDLRAKRLVFLAESQIHW